MPAPSQLAIAAGSVTRLLKEDASYHSELEGQKAAVATMEEKLAANGPSEDGNAEFLLKQQKTAMEQTKAVFGPLKERLTAAASKLEDLIAAGDGEESDIANAKDVLAQAKAKLTA